METKCLDCGSPGPEICDACRDESAQFGAALDDLTARLRDVLYNFARDRPGMLARLDDLPALTVRDLTRSTLE